MWDRVRTLWLSCCFVGKSAQKEVEAIVREAKKQGFMVKEKKMGWMIQTPNGQGSVMLHKTPSDHRAIRNDLARLRRYGFKAD
jgi:hypothetical protein